MSDNIKPKKIIVPSGKVAWCTGGCSKTQPYCDGSHAGTEHKPFVENIDRDTEMFICKCGKTNNKPFCDGSHNNQNHG